jgi:hypothetical protein
LDGYSVECGFLKNAGSELSRGTVKVEDRRRIILEVLFNVHAVTCKNIITSYKTDQVKKGEVLWRRK